MSALDVCRADLRAAELALKSARATRTSAYALRTLATDGGLCVQADRLVLALEARVKAAKRRVYLAECGAEVSP